MNSTPQGSSAKNKIFTFLFCSKNKQASEIHERNKIQLISIKNGTTIISLFGFRKNTKNVVAENLQVILSCQCQFEFFTSFRYFDKIEIFCRFNLLQTSVMSRMISTSVSNTSNKRLSPQPLIKPEKIIPEVKEEEEKVVIDPLKVRDYFGVHKLFSIKDLFEARVHLGHTPG